MSTLYEMQPRPVSLADSSSYAPSLPAMEPGLSRPYLHDMPPSERLQYPISTQSVPNISHPEAPTGKELAEGLHTYQEFEKEVFMLDEQLKDCESIRFLGPSDSFLPNSNILRDRLRQLFSYANVNATVLFPQVKRVFRFSTVEILNHNDPFSGYPLGMIYETFRSVLEACNQYEISVQRLTGASNSSLKGAFRGFLNGPLSKNYSSGPFQHNLEAPTVRDRLTINKDIGYYSDALRNFTGNLKRFEREAILEMRNSDRETLQNQSTIATFLSAVTATTIQFTFSDHSTRLAVAVNLLWLVSLTLSLSSAVASQLAIQWKAVVYHVADSALSSWISRSITKIPIAFLAVSILAFIAGLICFAFLFFSETVIGPVIACVAGSCTLLLLLVGIWLAFEETLFTAPSRIAEYISRKALNVRFWYGFRYWLHNQFQRLKSWVRPPISPHPPPIPRRDRDVEKDNREREHRETVRRPISSRSRPLPKPNRGAEQDNREREHEDPALSRRRTLALQSRPVSNGRVPVRWYTKMESVPARKSFSDPEYLPIEGYSICGCVSSPNGSYAAIISKKPSPAFSLQSTESSFRSLYQDEDLTSNITMCSWSPDSRRIALYGDSTTGFIVTKDELDDEKWERTSIDFRGRFAGWMSNGKSMLSVKAHFDSSSYWYKLHTVNVYGAKSSHHFDVLVDGSRDIVGLWPMHSGEKVMAMTRNRNSPGEYEMHTLNLATRTREHSIKTKFYWYHGIDCAFSRKDILIVTTGNVIHRVREVESQLEMSVMYMPLDISLMASPRFIGENDEYVAAVLSIDPLINRPQTILVWSIDTKQLLFSIPPPSPYFFNDRGETLAERSPTRGERDPYGNYHRGWRSSPWSLSTTSDEPRRLICLWATNDKDDKDPNAVLVGRILINDLSLDEDPDDLIRAQGALQRDVAIPA